MQEGDGTVATAEQIEDVFRRLEQVHPVRFFDAVQEIQTGMGAVLRLLNESGGTATAGEISAALSISTARVAVLLKKMAARGFITKGKGPLDARVTLVTLTEAGAAASAQLKAELFSRLGLVIDAVGEDRLGEFLSVLEEIKTAVDDFRPPEP